MEFKRSTPVYSFKHRTMIFTDSWSDIQPASRGNLSSR